MKRRVISLAIGIALVCCGDLVEAAAASPRLRGRGGRRGLMQDLCIDLGRRYGHHTFAVSSEDARWFRSRGATRGACKQVGRRARKRQQRVRAFCIDIKNDQRTLFAPKVATRWILRQGASMGACTSRASVNTMEMNLRDTGRVDYTSILVDNEWIATDVYVEDTGQLEEPLTSDPIIMSFTVDPVPKINGNTGCNNYWGSLPLFTDNELQVGGLATTRMYCHGVMDQENAFVRLMARGTFLYEVSDDQGELLLFETLMNEDGSQSKGDIMARFINPFE